MKYLSCEQIACPAASVSEALRLCQVCLLSLQLLRHFPQIKLGSLQGLLGALAVSDVLDSTKHFIRSPRCVSFHGAQTVDSPHFPIGAQDAMFSVRAHFATEGLLSCPEDKLSIFRVDHFTNYRHIYWALLRTQPIDAVQLVGPSHAIRNEVPVIMADVGDALCFFKPGFAF